MNKYIPIGKHCYVSYSKKYDVHNKSKNIYQLRELVGGNLINVNKLKKSVQKYSLNVSICYTYEIVKCRYEKINALNLCKYNIVQNSLKLQMFEGVNLYSKILPFCINFNLSNLNVRIYCNNSNIDVYLELNMKTLNLFVPIKMIDLLGYNKKIKIYVIQEYSDLDISKLDKKAFLTRGKSFFLDSIYKYLNQRVNQMINDQLRPTLKKCKYNIDFVYGSCTYAT